MNLQQFHMSNREARSIARSARFHRIESSERRAGDRVFRAFATEHNRALVGAR